jgi:hypothetical protein
MKNNLQIGNSVVWDFVFDVPQENGVVVGLNDNKVQVEYIGYQGKTYRDWLNMDEVVLESEWVF